MIKVKRAFPRDSVVKNPLPNAGEAGDMGSIPGSGKIPLEKETATHSSVLAWKNPMGRGAWWTTAHGGRRARHDLAAEHRRKQGNMRFSGQGPDLTGLVSS